MHNLARTASTLAKCKLISLTNISVSWIQTLLGFQTSFALGYFYHIHFDKVVRTEEQRKQKTWYKVNQTFLHIYKYSV